MYVKTSKFIIEGDDVLYKMIHCEKYQGYRESFFFVSYIFSRTTPPHLFGMKLVKEQESSQNNQCTQQVCQPQVHRG